MNTLFCFGLGFTATVLAEETALRDWRVAGTRRPPEDGPAAASPDEAHNGNNGDKSVPVYPFDGDRPAEAQKATLDAARDNGGRGRLAWLLSIPPGAAGDPVLTALTADERRPPAALDWVGYLSTTGVYGDRQGGWVDEDDAPAPATDRARRRAAAEAAWLAWGRRHDIPVQIFRLAGIYGPGRNALAQLRAGTARRLHKPGQVFSRVHVADIAQVLAAGIARPLPGRLYNVCDDEPAATADVVAHAAEIAGLPVPPLESVEDADLSPMARSFYAECRRVRNDRIKDELGVTLRYPTYREGLRALLEAGE